VIGFLLERADRHETTVSTIEDSPQTAAWLSESEGEQERAGHLAQPSSCGAQAPDPSLDLDLAEPMDATPPGLGLPRSRRIKQGRDFARAKAQGQRLAHGCLVLNWVPLPAHAFSRVGVIASRRVGGAVIRNRARRLLREAFRLNQHSLLQPVEVILVARPSIVDKTLAAVTVDYVGALRRARLYRCVQP
jgi:ribonuclease P protein component